MRVARRARLAPELLVLVCYLAWRIELATPAVAQPVAGSASLAGALIVGPAVNASRRAGNQTEPTIAVNPADPRQVAVFSNDEAVVPGLFAGISADGGSSWSGRSILGSGLSAACCDPQAAFDRFGNLFLAYLGSNRNIYVAISADGGVSFPSVVQLTTSGNADQPSVATGPGRAAGLESVWVSYERGGLIAARGAPVSGLGAVAGFAAEQVAPGGDGAYGDAEVGPLGQVLVVYQTEGPAPAGPSQILANLDPDGLGPAGFGPAVLAGVTQVGQGRLIPATSNSLGVDAEANLAWDRSGGRYGGRVYLVYTDAPTVTSSDLDVFLRYSDDGGASWSAATRLNDDGGGASQFMPSIAVDQSSGQVGVDWYDARASADQRQAQLYAAILAPGGVGPLENRPLIGALSNAAAADAGGGPFRPLGYGDYITSDFVDGAFWAVWSDNSAALSGNPALPRLDLGVVAARRLADPPNRAYLPIVAQP
jgi:hypothetical protein